MKRNLIEDMMPSCINCKYYRGIQYASGCCEKGFFKTYVQPANEVLDLQTFKCEEWKNHD